MELTVTNPQAKRSASIQDHLKKMGRKPGQEQRLRPFTPVFGYLFVLGFALFLLPLYLYMLFFNRAYFWLRNQPRISAAPYFTLDRHKIAHLARTDKLWCEYCEWANGTLQWTLRITNEIERRYCPIKNGRTSETTADKPWRENFLAYDHNADDLEQYYEEQYLKDSEQP